MFSRLAESFVTLFVVLDPVGSVPIFLGATQRLAPGDRRKVAIVAVLVGSTVYATWWTSAVAGSTAGEQVWFQPVGWADAGISWSGTELLLPRLAAHRVGDQRAPALAPSTLEPEGGLVSAWDDLGKTFGLGEGNGDVVVELVPTPVLRIGAQ